MKSKQIPELSLQRESLGVHAAHPSHHIWVREADRWSPPVLTAPSDGRVYSPPSTPVAHIEPYVEPQVMYNPYFLWQLYSYKQSCNNNYYSLSQYQKICWLRQLMSWLFKFIKNKTCIDNAQNQIKCKYVALLTSIRNYTCNCSAIIYCWYFPFCIVKKHSSFVSYFRITILLELRRLVLCTSVCLKI